MNYLNAIVFSEAHVKRQSARQCQKPNNSIIIHLIWYSGIVDDVYDECGFEAVKNMRVAAIKDTIRCSAFSTISMGRTMVLYRYSDVECARV